MLALQTNVKSLHNVDIKPISFQLLGDFIVANKMWVRWLDSKNEAKFEFTEVFSSKETIYWVVILA